MAITVNEGTAKSVATDAVGSLNYQVIKLDVGAAGTTSPFTGTIAAVSNLAGGTLNVLTDGTISKVTNLAGGTLGILTDGTISKVTNLAGGTINVLTDGSVKITGGTITTGTIVNSGTTTGVGTVSGMGTVSGVGTIAGVGVIGNLNSGTVAMSLGTVSSHKSILDTNNFSTATLAANGTYTGTATDILGYDGVIVSAFSDVASATDGLKVQYSFDATNWDHQFANSVPAGDEKSVDMYARARYYRVVYVNGAGSQSAFRLYSELKLSPPVPTIKEIGLPMGTTDMVSHTRSLIAGTSTAGGGALVEVKVAPSGAIQVGGAVDVTTGTIVNSGTTTGVGTVSGVGVIGNVNGGTIATNILPLGGVVKTTAIVCGTSATALPASALTSRKSLITYNIGTIPCYIGDSTVSVTSGIPIGTSQYSPAMDLGTTILYGVASAASGGTLVVLEIS